ncbi:MAG TPA: histidine kinase [Pyrinomonadaceae bacterium]|nr:histidine kinase [Pyrinomonadaceae bacterium]
MGFVSDAELVVSGVYLALGLMYARFWWDEHDRRDYLAFTIACLAAAGFAWCEMGMMVSRTPEQYLHYAWISFLPGTIYLSATAWFIRIHLQGRRWMFWTYLGLRVSALAVHLVLKNGINFREVTGLGQTTLLGETLAFPIAVPNPWMLISHFSHLLLLIYCLDASLQLWKRGDRRKAVVFGLVFSLFESSVILAAAGPLWGLVPVPVFASVPMLLILGAMLYDLNYDMHRAAMLSDKLEEREARLSETLEHLQLSAAAGSVGMWTRTVGAEDIWVSEKAGEIWGFPRGRSVSREELLQQIHPNDRKLFVTTSRELEDGKNDFQLEYRMLSDDANVRWIHTSGKVEEVNGSRIIRGAIVDITKLKLAEDAIRELSRRLVDAQEKERARLARELHDDLSQSIALLAIQLGTLRNDATDLASVKDKLDGIVSDVQRLARDIYRISHELHPVALTQLGLESAIRVYCREFSAKYPVEVDFTAEGVSADMPQATSLCLYRITQEALNNIAKHSGASHAQVNLTSDVAGTRLSVLDDGRGFDPAVAKQKTGLGLISMTERARHVNGKVNVVSSIGEGVRIEVNIPIDRVRKATLS